MKKNETSKLIMIMNTNRNEAPFSVPLDVYWLNIETIVFSTILAFSKSVAVTSIKILRVLRRILECSPEFHKH